MRSFKYLEDFDKVGRVMLNCVQGLVVEKVQYMHNYSSA